MLLNEDLSVIARRVTSGDVLWFVGAGMSVEAGLPCGHDLAREIECAFAMPPTSDSLPDVAQRAYDAGFEGDLKALVAERMRSAAPSEAHRALTHLAPGPIYTTNYDCLVEEALGRTARVYSRDTHLPLRGSSGTPVYKLHGCIERDPEGIVVARSDYSGEQLSRRLLVSQLRADAARSSVIFVGYGMTDDYLRFLFEDVLRTLGHLRRRSWVVAPSFASEVSERLEALRIRPVPLPAGEFFGKIARLAAPPSHLEEVSSHGIATPDGRNHMAFSVPQFRAERFVNRRDELKLLADAFQRMDGVVVAGQPGIGKRQLVLSFLDSVRSPVDEHLWLDAQVGPECDANLRAVREVALARIGTRQASAGTPARHVVVACVPDRTAATAALHVLHDLSDVTGRRSLFWVLVTPDPVHPLPPRTAHIGVEELSRQASVRLVRTVSPALPDKAARQVAARVGGVPRSLMETAHLCAARGVTDMAEAESMAAQVLRGSGPRVLAGLLDPRQHDLLSRVGLLALPFYSHTAERLSEGNAGVALRQLVDLDLVEEVGEQLYQVTERTQEMLGEPSTDDRVDVAQRLLRSPVIDPAWPLEAMFQFILNRDGGAVLGHLQEWGSTMIDWGLGGHLSPMLRRLVDDPPEWFEDASPDAGDWAQLLLLQSEGAAGIARDITPLSELVDRISAGTVLHALSLNLRGIWRHEQGDLPGAAKDLNAGIGEFEEIGDWELADQARHNLALVLASQGNAEEAKRRLCEIRERAHARGRSDSAATATAMLGVLEAEGGNLPDAEDLLREAVTTLGPYGSVEHAGILRFDLGNVILEQERWQEGEQWMRAAVESLSPIPESPWFRRAILAATHAGIKARGTSGAREVVSDLTGLLHEHGREAFGVYSLLQAGYDLTQGGQLEEAGALVEEAVAESLRQDDPKLCASVVREAFEVLGPVGSPAGVGYVVDALDLVGRMDPIAATELGLHAMFRSVERGQPIWARVLAATVARLARSVDEDTFAARAYGDIGAILREIPDPQLGRRWFRRALRRYEEIGSLGAQAALLHEIGNTFAETRQWQRALRSYQQGAELANTVSDRRTGMGIQMSVAEVKLRQGDATGSAELNLAILGELPEEDLETRAFVAHNLSLACLMQGNDPEGERWNDRSLRWAREAGDPEGVIKALRLEAMRALDRGEPNYAVELQRQVLSEAREAGLMLQAVTALRDIADIAWREGDHEEAEQTLQEALDTAVEAGHWALVSGLTGRASIMMAEDGEWEEAGKLFAQSFIFAALAGTPAGVHLHWRDVCFGALVEAASVDAVDEFQAGAVEAFAGWGDSVLGDAVAALRDATTSLTEDLKATITRGSNDPPDDGASAD